VTWVSGIEQGHFLEERGKVFENVQDRVVLMFSIVPEFITGRGLSWLLGLVNTWVIRAILSVPQLSSAS
jgi:hypothetical protein